MTQMFSIGEFSKMSGMTVKSLRYYHEQQLLQPSFVDSGSGYRYTESSTTCQPVKSTTRALV